MRSITARIGRDQESINSRIQSKTAILKNITARFEGAPQKRPASMKSIVNIIAKIGRNQECLVQRRAANKTAIMKTIDVDIKARLNAFQDKTARKRNITASRGNQGCLIKRHTPLANARPALRVPSAKAHPVNRTLLARARHRFCTQLVKCCHRLCAQLVRCCHWLCALSVTSCRRSRSPPAILCSWPRSQCCKCCHPSAIFCRRPCIQSSSRLIGGAIFRFTSIVLAQGVEE